MRKLKAISFFAGVGGIDKGFEEAGFKTIWANEIDPYAAETFKANFKCKLVVKDIREVKLDEIPEFDVMLAGFPCQAFSLAGYRKGFNDERGNLYFELVRIFEARKPKVIFLENVKNLVGHDNGKTFRIILERLIENGYTVKYKVLNACEYGNIPQNRERIYIVAFKEKRVAEKFEFPYPVELKIKLHDLIDYENKVDSRYYYTKDTCKFYDELEREMKKMDTTYQWRRIYVRENKSNLCPTLTANMGTGGHNVPLVFTKTGIRKLTPRECFNLQGFNENFILPKELSNTRLYKQAGNSVTVPVIKRIAKNINKAIKDAERSL